MTGIVLPRPEYVALGYETTDFCMRLRKDGTFIEGVERGMKARSEGRVKSWIQVKRELGI